jgi:hypothetical protein
MDHRRDNSPGVSYGNVYLLGDISGTIKDVTSVELRNIKWKNTFPYSYASHWHSNNYSVPTRYVDSVLDGEGATVVQDFPVAGASIRYGDAGFQGNHALTFVDTVALLHSKITSSQITTTSDWGGHYNFDKKRSVAKINTSTGAAVVYNPAGNIEKDFTIHENATFSWKSILRTRACSPLSMVYPITSIMVSASRVVSISIRVRRDSTTENEIGLLVQVNGTAGASIASLKEKYTKASGPVNTWETLNITYIPVVSGCIDIYVARAGLYGKIAWFTNFSVVEQ